MSKRRADKELNHDNWNVEDDSPTEDMMGPFKRASDEELAKRKIKTARRRGNMAEESTGPSVFKNFAGFGSIASGGSSKLPGFDFMGKKPNESGSSAFTATGFKVPTSSAEADKSEVSFKMPTASTTSSSGAPTFSFGSNSSPSATQNKTNGVGANSPTKSSSSLNFDANDKSYLASLKVLNETVMKWIQKHVEKNSYISLIPVFDDYRRHFTALEKKYEPKFAKKAGLAPIESSNGSDTKKQTDDFSSSPPNKTGASASPAKSAESVKETSTAKAPEIKPFSFKPTAATTATKSPVQSPVAENPKPAPTFSFGSSNKISSSTTPSTFSFGSSSATESSAPTFNFGGGSTQTTGESKGFSFGSSGTNLTFGAKDSTTPASKGFSFGSGAPPFTFNPAPPSSAPTSSATGGEDGDYTPPQPDVLEVKEENSVYDKKCKLFYKSNNTFVDKGVGTLFLKPVPDSTKTQLIVRAATSLGNVLLNIILNASMPTQRMGKNNVLIACVPNPPVDAKADKTPVSMLIRVKTSDDADELLKKIDEFKNK